MTIVLEVVQIHTFWQESVQNKMGIRNREDKSEQSKQIKPIGLGMDSTTLLELTKYRKMTVFKVSLQPNLFILQKCNLGPL